MAMFFREEWARRNKSVSVTISHDPFTPYVEENLGNDFVYIESREQRKKLLRERGFEILPASNRRASPKPIYVFQR